MQYSYSCKSMLLLLLVLAITHYTKQTSIQGSIGFPSTVFVVTDKIELKGIAEVDVGDRVKSIDSSGNIIDDEIIAWLQYDELARGSFLSMKLMSGETLDVKPKQVVFEVSTR